MFTSYEHATRLAANVGKVMAVLFAVVGILYGHLMLILIAGFVYLAGSAEANAVGRPWGHADSPTTVGQPWTRAVRNGNVVTAIWDNERCAYRIVPDACSV
jgi:hypothetical protein